MCYYLRPYLPHKVYNVMLYGSAVAKEAMKNTVCLAVDRECIAYLLYALPVIKVLFLLHFATSSVVWCVLGPKEGEILENS